MGVNTQMLLSIDQLIGSSNHVFSAPVGIHKAKRPCHRPELLRHQDGPLPPELLDGRKKGHARAASTWVCVKMHPQQWWWSFWLSISAPRRVPSKRIQARGRCPQGAGRGTAAVQGYQVQELIAMFSFLVLFHLVVYCVLKGSSPGKLGRAQ